MALRLARTSIARGIKIHQARPNITKKKKILPSPLQLKSHERRGRDQVPVSPDDIFFPNA